MTFVKLTNSDGLPTWVRPERVEYIDRPASAWLTEVGALSGEKAIHVTESPDEVRAILEFRQPTPEGRPELPEGWRWIGHGRAREGDVVVGADLRSVRIYLCSDPNRAWTAPAPVVLACIEDWRRYEGGAA